MKTIELRTATILATATMAMTMLGGVTVSASERVPVATSPDEIVLIFGPDELGMFPEVSVQPRSEWFTSDGQIDPLVNRIVREVDGILIKQTSEEHVAGDWGPAYARLEEYKRKVAEQNGTVTTPTVVEEIEVTTPTDSPKTEETVAEEPKDGNLDPKALEGKDLGLDQTPAGPTDSAQETGKSSGKDQPTVAPKTEPTQSIAKVKSDQTTPAISTPVTKSDTKTLPKTGETTNLLAYLGLAITAVLAMVTRKPKTN